MRRYTWDRETKVVFCAPNWQLYVDAIDVLERDGYQEVRKKGVHTLRPGQYSAYFRSMRVVWFEPKRKVWNPRYLDYLEDRIAQELQEKTA